MKKILSLLSLLLVMAACSTDKNFDDVYMATNEGAARLSIAQQSEALADQSVVVKIYQVVDGEENLVRRYTSMADVPSTINFLAGEYVAKVVVGDKRVATFDGKYYSGEQSFTVEAGIVTSVAVDCKLVSTIVAVNYDATVAEKLDAGFATTVAVSDTYDQSAVNTGDIHSLKYTESKEGYFILPEEQTSLVWHFEGNHPEEGAIVKEAVIENVKAAAKYTITLKYSADAPGGLVIEATVDESLEEKDDTLIFSPDPTLLGVGFDVAEEQSSIAESLTYKVSSLAAIDTFTITADGVEYNLLTDTITGVTVDKVDDLNYNITIADDFFSLVSGGQNALTFFIEDVDGGKLEKDVIYNVQGVLPLTTSDYDLWFGNVTFKAMVLNTSASSVKVAYSADGSTWSEVDATLGADGNYTATGADFAADKNYRYKLVVDSADAGKTLSHETAAGAQIPNGDMESWSTSNDIVFPYAAGASPFWLTGNEGGAMAGATLTQSSTDVRPGSTGQYSAHLKSQFASVMGIGKFAAGNLFVGTFSMSGMNGTVSFGRDFNFTAKPKSLSFWMKHNEGTINQNEGTPAEATGTDKASMYVLITNWDAPYAVNTADQSTFFTMADLATMEGVIGYGYLEKRESATEWAEYTLDITYREDMKSVKPKKLVVSFTPSGFGDYFTGSTDSWMYVDDIVLNY
ncbi:MAG: DUF4493 domain-containing protein [Alistipes sp.]|nr:DUF4493 domain-containing protein [Alistipes sp.]